MAGKRMRKSNAVLLSVCLLATACATPSFQQRQEAWRKHMTTQQATCRLGAIDPAMPDDVRVWCAEMQP
jgi:hypothetical protein